MIKFHMRKMKALHTHSVNILWISAHSNTVCCGEKYVGVRCTFWRNTGPDQLSPRHVENTGSTLFHVEFIFGNLNIKPKHSRFSWYKSLYSPKHVSPSHVSIFDGGVFWSSPDSDFFFTRIWLKYIPDHLLILKMCVPKIMKFDKRLTEQITRGDNWPIASNKPFFIHHNFNFINL